MTTKIKTYSELITFDTFEERFAYLKLDGIVGHETFGFKRWINQKLYHSPEWFIFRDQIIIRDGGCDLGVPGFEIHGSILIHHINPITYEDILYNRPCVFDPENVISTRHRTHNAIHYGDEKLLLLQMPVERCRNDTSPWRIL